MPKDKRVSKIEILRAIRNSLVHHGVPPTVEELRSALGVGSTRTVQRYLEWLEEEGDLERWSGARGMRLLRDPDQGVKTRAVPLVGEAPAGPLMLAEENREGWLRLPLELASPASASFFLLRVRGDSMNRARVGNDIIEGGDLVLVRQQPTAESGSIVVALIDGEATIKRFTRGPGYVLLQPESSNSEHQPILIDQDFRILGAVTRVIKKGSELLSFGGGFDSTVS
jgi:repressor LexA